MKFGFRFFVIFLMLLSGFSSCKQDEDLTGDDRFLGEYSGSVSYSGVENQDFSETITVTVSKRDQYWKLSFTNDIPPIDSILLDLSPNGEVMLNKEADEEHLIRITSHSLQVEYTKDSAVWKAHCTRD